MDRLHSSVTSSKESPPEARMASCASRRSASPALLARMVESGPRWPVLSASRKTRASGPRISPDNNLVRPVAQRSFQQIAESDPALVGIKLGSAEMTCRFRM
jgi:hypothetical protein